MENKIGAAEQAEQLKRDYDWEETQRGVYDMRQLIFLTVSGYESQTIRDGLYLRMSYQKHIRSWLLEVEELVRAPSVKEIIRQYWEIVDAFND